MIAFINRIGFSLISLKWSRIAMFLWIGFLFFFVSCDTDSEETPPEITTPTESTPGLVEALESEYSPLSSNPLDWSDSELAFLDNLSSKKVIGLGEATHGTAEFFNAKFQIFKYMVENHGLRVFAIEADFGESMFINDAIQRGATEEIEELMRTKMIFWTWNTQEVKALLEWMSDYNKNKSDEEKLQYFGVDTQFNLHNIDLLRDYLQENNAPFKSFANNVLQEAEDLETTDFASYDEEEFSVLMNRLDQVRDSIQFNEATFINESSEKTYKLHLRLASVIQQTLQVGFARANNDLTVSYRDKYMAENTLWVSQFFDDAPVVLWAHNAHISKDPLFGGAGGAIGRHLQLQLGTNYEAVGFLFAQGSFNAVSVSGNQSSNLEEQNINTAPKANSLNSVMSRAAATNLRIDLSRLDQYESWIEAYANSMEFFHIGAIYNQNPLDYYLRFNPVYYDQIIFFERSTASDLLVFN